jgi:hypothetical protein
MMLGWGTQYKSISLCFGEAGECVWFTANSSPLGAPQVTTCLFTSRGGAGASRVAGTVSLCQQLFVAYCC